MLGSENVWLCWCCISMSGLKVTRVEMEPGVMLSLYVGSNRKRRGIIVLIWKYVVKTYSCYVRARLFNYNVCVKFGAWVVSDVWCTMWIWMKAFKSLRGTEMKEMWNHWVCVKICGRFGMLMWACVVGKDMAMWVWCGVYWIINPFIFMEVSILPLANCSLCFELRGKIVQVIFTHT